MGHVRFVSGIGRRINDFGIALSRILAVADSLINITFPSGTERKGLHTGELWDVGHQVTP